MKIKSLLAVCGLLVISSQLQAGGFWLEPGNPKASAEARAVNAVIVMRAVGCHNPEDAKVTATAIGMVDGKRVTTPLKLVKLSIPGAYAVARQWPAEGQWVLEFVGVNGDLTTSAVLPANGDEVARHEGKFYPRRATPDEVNAVLTARR